MKTTKLCAAVSFVALFLLQGSAFAQTKIMYTEAKSRMLNQYQGILAVLLNIRADTEVELEEHELREISGPDPAELLKIASAARPGFDIGPTYCPRPRFQVDISYMRLFSGNEYADMIAAGFSFPIDFGRFKKDKDPED